MNERKLFGADKAWHDYSAATVDPTVGELDHNAQADFRSGYEAGYQDGAQATARIEQRIWQNETASAVARLKAEMGAQAAQSRQYREQATDCLRRGAMIDGADLAASASRCDHARVVLECILHDLQEKP